MTNLTELKTADLTGEALNWAVAKALGLNAYLAEPQYGNPHLVMIRHTPAGCKFEQVKRFDPSNDWLLYGEHLSNKITTLSQNVDGYTEPDQPWYAECGVFWNIGTTPLIAACLAFVEHATGHQTDGDTVNVPSELIPK